MRYTDLLYTIIFEITRYYGKKCEIDILIFGNAKGRAVALPCLPKVYKTRMKNSNSPVLCACAVAPPFHRAALAPAPAGAFARFFVFSQSDNYRRNNGYYHQRDDHRSEV